MTRYVEVVEGPVFGKCPVVSAQMSPCWGDLLAYQHQPDDQPEGLVTVQCVECGGLLSASVSAGVERDWSWTRDGEVA